MSFLILRILRNLIGIFHTGVTPKPYLTSTPVMVKRANDFE